MIGLQEFYVFLKRKILIRLQLVKYVCIPSTKHFKISDKLSSQTEKEEKERMFRVPYSNAVGRGGAYVPCSIF